MKEQIENLIEYYNSLIEDIPYSRRYEKSSKTQIVSVLKEVINDLNIIVNNDRTSYPEIHN